MAPVVVVVPQGRAALALLAARPTLRPPLVAVAVAVVTATARALRAAPTPLRQEAMAARLKITQRAARVARAALPQQQGVLARMAPAVAVAVAQPQSHQNLAAMAVLVLNSTHLTAPVAAVAAAGVTATH
jgi:hypothetical protein